MTDPQRIKILQTWAILVFAASRGELMSYDDLAKGLGQKSTGKKRPSRITQYPLGKIKMFCEGGKKPPLTSIVGNAHSYWPGEGYASNMLPGELAKDRARVFRYKSWHKEFTRFNSWLNRQ